MRMRHFWIFVGLCAMIGTGLVLDEWLDIAQLQAWHQQLEAEQARHPWWFMIGYGVFFTLLIAFYVPGALPFLILAGALFDFWIGVAIITVSNAIGATAGYLLAKRLFFESFQEKYGDRATVVNAQIKRHGALYLLFLRVVPIMPSPLVNLLMGLTPITLWTFFWVTFWGRLPLTMGYVKLGGELSELRSFHDVWSPELIGTIVLLAFIMLGARYWMARSEMKAATASVE
jgi:uncharacterized membrane protein YdjX (TVP38/TMEM64 family)